jgi:hypothetical protein
VNDSGRIDAEQIPIVGEVMDGAEGDPVDYGGNPVGAGERNDVGRLDKLGFAQCANRTSLPIRPDDVAPKSDLIESLGNHDELLSTSAFRGDDALPLGVLMGETDLEHHDPVRRVIRYDEDRCDDVILAWGDAQEIDHRALELVGGPQRPIVGLVGGAGSVAVKNRPRLGVRLVLVRWASAGLGWRRGKAQGRRSSLLLGAMDPAVERAEADPRVTVTEALPKRDQRDDVAIGERELARPGEG